MADDRDRPIDPIRIPPPPSATIESVFKGPLHQFVVVVSELQPAALEQIKQTIIGSPSWELRAKSLEAALRGLVDRYHSSQVLIELAGVINEAEKLLDG